MPAFDGFLDWSEEHGLPLKEWAEGLEEKGIPPLPAFLVVILLIIAGTVLLAAPFFLQQQTGVVDVTVTSGDGAPLGGITVSVASTGAESSFALQTNVTDVSGRASFTGIPAESVKVTAVSDQYEAVDEIVEVEAGKVLPVELQTQEVVSTKVSLAIDLQGPTDDSAATTILYDELYNVVDSQNGLKASFSVDASKKYFVKASAAGFSDATQPVAVADKGAFVTILLTPLPTKREGTVHAYVFSRQGEKRVPVANATVDFLDAQTKSVLLSARTGEDGNTAPQKLEEGTRIIARATHKNYQAKASEAIVVAGETSVAIEVRDNGPTQTLSVRVEEEGGNALEAAYARLWQYNGEWLPVDEKRTFEGNAEFVLQKSEKYAFSAWLQGYQPVFLSKIEAPQRTVRLKKSVDGSRLRVRVANYDGSDAAGATLAVFSQDGTPTGVIEKVTGIDGVQEFVDLPKTSVLIKAQQAGRSGVATATLRSENESATITLARGVGSVRARVIDHFTQKPIANARVVVAGFNESTCVTGGNGECIAQTAEFLGATATITAVGYDAYVASSFTVKPGLQSETVVEMIPASVAATTKAEFVGLFNAKGEKVLVAEPSSIYKARFLLRAPPIGFDNATLFVYLGKASEPLDKSGAVITGYSGEATSVFAGDSLQAAIDASATAESIGRTGGTALKWVEFRNAKFSGVRQYDVVVQARPVTSGGIELNYRTAFKTNREVLRDPADAKAGVATSELVAAANQKNFAINFEGSCKDDLCVQLRIVDEDGNKSVASYESSVGKQFSLVVKALSLNASVQVKAESAGVALGIVRAESGSQQTTPIVSDGKTSATITTDGEATFVMRSQRISRDAPILITVLRKDAVAFEKTVYVRINSLSSPQLRVSFSPRSLVALEASTLSVEVRDSLGLPVDAHVTVGSVADALARVTEAASKGNGKYSAEAVTPGGVGVVALQAEAEGFELFKTTIPVAANKIIELKENDVSLTLPSRQPVEAPFTVNNLVNNDASVSVLIVKSSFSPSIEVTAEPTFARVPAKSSFAGVVRAAITQSVAGVAARQKQFSEAAGGTVRVTASVGATRQTVELPFTAKAQFNQLAIDDAWEVDAEEISIELTPPDELQKSVSVRVSNNGPQSLIINQQLDVPITVSPLSAELAAGGTQLFTLTASSERLFKRDECIFSQSDKRGTLSLFAGYADLRSKKTLPITIATRPSGKCLPESAKSVVLPTTIIFEVPASAKKRVNNDESTTIQFDDGTRLLLPPATTRKASSFEVPAGESFFLPATATSGDAASFTITLPTPATIVLPPGAPIVNRDGKKAVVVGQTLLLLPAVASLAAESEVRLAAGTVVEARPLPATDFSLHQKVSLPAGLVFHLPGGTVLKENVDESFAALTASGQAIGFPATAEKTPQEIDGKFDVVVRPSAAMLLPPSFATLLAGNGVALSLPFAMDVEIPAETEVVTRGNNVVAFLFNYDVYLPKATAFSSSEGGKKALVPANSIIEFRRIDAASLLSANKFVKLPATIRLTLPAGARVETTTSGTVVSLADGAAIALPQSVEVSGKKLDGTIDATVPAGAQFSLPQNWVALSPTTIKLNIPVAHNYIVPQATQLLQATTTTLLLEEHDLKVAKTTLSADGENAATQPTAGNEETFVAVADIDLSQGKEIVLPFDYEWRLPQATRAKKTTQSTAFLLPTGEKMGFSSGETNGLVATASAGATVFLPQSFLKTDGKITLQLPFATSILLNDAVESRSEASVIIVGNDYKATLPSTTQINAKGDAKTARVPPNAIVGVEATAFSAIGVQQQLPVSITALLPANAIVRQKSDGTVYAESFNTKLLFGTGSAAMGKNVFVPANTPIVFPPSAITRLNAPIAGQFNYKITLPFPLLIELPQEENIAANTDGTTSVIAGGTTIVLPAAATISKKDAPTATVPANSPITFIYTPLASTPGSEANALSSQLSAGGQAALAAKSNLVALLPATTEFIVPASTRLTGQEGGANFVAWITESTVVVFPASSQSTKIIDGSVSIKVNEGSQVSLPPDVATPLEGGISFNTPFATTIRVPADTNVFEEANVLRVLLEEKRTQLIIPAGSGQAKAQDELLFTLQPSSRIEIRPIDQPSFAGNAPIRAPLDATLLLPANARTSTTGSTTTVWFPDGTTAQFSGAPENSPQGKILLWATGTTALLPPQHARLVDANGGVRLSLPVPLSISLPQDSSITQRGATTIAISSGTMIRFTAAIRQQNSFTITAGSVVEALPFALDVFGPTIHAPFEIRMILPPDAIVDDQARGGVVVEFSNGLRAKFGGGSAVTSGTLEGFYPQFGGVGFGGIGGFGGLQGFGTPIGFPQRGFPTQYPLSSKRGDTVLAPKLAPITLAPPLFIGSSPTSFSFLLPASYQAFVDSESPVYTNVDGSLSVFSRDVEVRLPPSAQRLPSSSPSGVGAVALGVPPLQPVSVTQIFSGRIPGESITLPFDLKLRLPPTARILPISLDGSRTIDFGNGARAVFTRDLIVDERIVRGNVPQFNEVLVTAGTPVTFSQGIVRSTLSPPTGLPASRETLQLQIPSRTVAVIPDNVKVHENIDGSKSAYFDEFELQLPASARQAPLRNREASYEIPASALIKLVPLQSSDGIDKNAFSLPLAAIFQVGAARQLPSAKDGSKPFDFGGKTIVFGQDASLQANALSIPAHSLFYPDESMLQRSLQEGNSLGAFAANQIISFRTPATLVLQAEEAQTPAQGVDGTQSIFFGEKEIVLGPGTQAQLTQSKGQYIVPQNSFVRVQPIDSTLSKNTVPISLPVDAEFSFTPSTKAFTAAPDGARAVKFAEGKTLVVQSDAVVRGQPPKLLISAGSRFSASAPLVKELDGAKKTNSLVAAQSIRFALPVQTKFSIPASLKVTQNTDGSASLSDGYSELVLPHGTRIEKVSGTSTATVAENSLVEVRQIDYGTEGLTPVTLPTRAVLLLPPSAKAFASPDADVVVVQLSSGERLAARGTLKEKTVGAARRVDVAEQQQLLLPEGMVATAEGNGFDVTLPINSRIVFAKNVEVKGNAVRTEGEQSVYFSFAPKLRAGTGELGEASASTLQFVEVPAGSKVSFGPTQYDFDEKVGKAAQGETGSLEFVMSEEVFIAVVAPNEIVSSGNSVSAVQKQCYALEAKNKAGELVMRFPESAGFVAAPATLQDKGNKNFEVIVPAGGKISLKNCNPTDAGAQIVAVRTKSRTTFILPPGEVMEELQGEIKFVGSDKKPECKEVSTIGLTLPFSGVSSIDFGSGNIIELHPNRKIDDPGIKQVFAGKLKQQVVVGEGSEIKFTVCGGAKSKQGQATITDADLQRPALIFDRAPIKLVIEEPGRSAPGHIVVRNALSETLTVTANGGGAGPDAALSEFVEKGSIVWKSGFQESKSDVQIIPHDKEDVFVFTATIPADSDLLDASTGCIVKEKKVSGKINFAATGAATNKRYQLQPVDVEILIKPSPGKCVANIDKLQQDRLFGLYATNAFSIVGEDDPSSFKGFFRNLGKKIVFKGDGTASEKHVRYFSVVNNRNEKVTITANWNGNAVAECTPKIYSPEGSTENAPLEKFDLKNGSVAVVTCKPKKVESGIQATKQLLLTATGEKSKDSPTKITIDFLVYKPHKDLAKLYDGTPLGKLASEGNVAELQGKIEEQNAQQQLAAVEQARKTAEKPTQEKATEDNKKAETQTSTAKTAGKGVLYFQGTKQTAIVPGQISAATTSASTVEWAYCEELFCSKQQVKDAFVSSAGGVFAALKNRISPSGDEGRVDAVDLIKAFTEKNAELHKSVVIQKAGGDSLSKSEIEEAVRAGLSGYGVSASVSIDDNEMNGCGIWVAHYSSRKLSAAVSSSTQSKGEDAVKDFLDALSVDVKVKKAAKCEENLNNLPLLMGAPSEKDVTITLGRKPASTLSLSEAGSRIKENLKKAQEADTHLGAALSALRISAAVQTGPYNLADSGGSPADEEIAKSVLQTMFGDATAESRLAEPYSIGTDAAGFCVYNGVTNAIKIGGSIAAVHAGIVIFSGGTTLPFTAVMAALAGKELAACGISAAASTVTSGAVSGATGNFKGGGTLTCSAVNNCIRTVAFAGLLPTGAGSLSAGAKEVGFTTFGKANAVSSLVAGSLEGYSGTNVNPAIGVAGIYAARASFTPTETQQLAELFGSLKVKETVGTITSLESTELAAIRTRLSGNTALADAVNAYEAARVNKLATARLRVKEGLSAKKISINILRVLPALLLDADVRPVEATGDSNAHQIVVFSQQPKGIGAFNSVLASVRRYCDIPNSDCKGDFTLDERCLGFDACLYWGKRVWDKSKDKYFIIISVNGEAQSKQTAIKKTITVGKPQSSETKNSGEDSISSNLQVKSNYFLGSIFSAEDAPIMTAKDSKQIKIDPKSGKLAYNERNNYFEVK